MSKPQPTKAKKIYNIVSTTIIAVIFVFLVVIVSLMLAQRKSGGDSKIFGYYMYDVVTDSMSGTIEPADVILCKSIDDKNALKEGDIITFVAPSGVLKGQNITHRIIEVHRAENGAVEYFITKGDNPNVGVDNWQLSPDSVKAKFVRKSVFIGGLRRFLSHWYGYVLLIALPLSIVGVLIIVGFVQDKVAAEKSKSAKLDESSIDNLTDEQKKRLLDEILTSRNKDGGDEK